MLNNIILRSHILPITAKPAKNHETNCYTKRNAMSKLQQANVVMTVNNLTIEKNEHYLMLSYCSTTLYKSVQCTSIDIPPGNKQRLMINHGTWCKVQLLYNLQCQKQNLPVLCHITCCLYHGRIPIGYKLTVHC